MLAHHLRSVLEVVPEALDFIKQASLEKDFPVDNKDSAAASYLTAAYLTKSAGKVLDVDLLKKLEKAASLYGIKGEMDKFIPRFTQMTKQASEEETIQMVKEAEAMFSGDLSGFLNIIKASEKADDLMQKYAEKITSEDVKRYAGKAWLNKEAAVQSLANRHVATKGKVPEFLKIARLVLDSVKENDFKGIHDVCKATAELDKKAGIDIIGFNPFVEFLITKEAALAKGLMVKLAGKEVPWTKIAALGNSRIESYLGKEACVGLSGECVNDKYILEAMPRGLQMQLTNILKSV